jgi:formimidoylglutamate deiminase
MPEQWWAPRAWVGERWRDAVSLDVAPDGTWQRVEPDTPRAPHAQALPGPVLPGLVNAHSHAFQRLFRGRVQHRLADRDDFWTWRERMYHAANTLDPDGVEAVSALLFLELAEAGTTRVGEFHYLQTAPGGRPYADPDELAKRILAAAATVGIGITLLRVGYYRGGPGHALRPEQSRFGDPRPEDTLEAAYRLREAATGTVRVGVAPHSVRAVDEAGLRVFAAWDGVVHSHVSEQPAENRMCLEEHGRSPLAVLADAGLVTDRFTAVHLTWPLEGDVDRLARAGGRVCYCPATELDLGDGFLPLEARERLPVCVGSDSQATIEPLADARALELHARPLAGRRNVLAPAGEGSGLAERLLHTASTVGDRALGGDGAGIADGAQADLVSIDLRRPAAEGVPPLEAAAFVATPAWVDDVWVAGRRIVSGGVHVARDAVVRAARPYLPPV